MTPEENQSELKRHRDIVLATIDYILETTAGRLKFDQFDPTAQHYQRLKQQTERHYQKSRLERLKKMLRDMTEVPWHTGDVNFGRYIKERTGYDIDIFENLQSRIDKIIEQKRIKNKDEYRDVIAMTGVCRQTQVEQDKIDILNNLRIDFDDRISRRKSSRKDSFVSSQLSEIYSPDNKRKLTISESGTDKDYSVTQVSIHLEQAGGDIYAANGISLDIKACWKDNSTVVIETKKDYTVLIKYQQLQSFQDIVRIEYIET